MAKKKYLHFDKVILFKATNKLLSAMKNCKLNGEEIEELKKRLEHMMLICDKTLKNYTTKLNKLNDSD